MGGAGEEEERRKQEKENVQMNGSEPDEHGYEAVSYGVASCSNHHWLRA